ncbi:MAG: M12 family metallopeptidase [Solirubrobacteraceae bacterium]
MRLWLLSLSVLGSLLLAAPASAYEVVGRPWPGPRITYFIDARDQAEQVQAGAQEWNALDLGVRFSRTTSRSKAQVRIRYGSRGCGGAALVGYPGRRYQSEVRLGRGCKDSLTFLTIVHELGHVLGLGHERSRCALMNTSADYATGTPNRCAPRPLSFWLAKPLRKDDVAGARKLYG